MSELRRLQEVIADLLKALEEAKGAVEWMAEATDSDPEDQERLYLVNRAIIRGNSVSMNEPVLKAIALQWIANRIETGTAPDQRFREQLRTLGLDYSTYLTDRGLSYIENEVFEFIDNTRDKTHVLDGSRNREE